MAKVLATHGEYKKIWIIENMTKADREILQLKIGRGQEQKWTKEWSKNTHLEG